MIINMRINEIKEKRNHISEKGLPAQDGYEV
jgi:hypothetical protein